MFEVSHIPAPVADTHPVGRHGQIGEEVFPTEVPVAPDSTAEMTREVVDELFARIEREAKLGSSQRVGERTAQIAVADTVKLAS